MARVKNSTSPVRDKKAGSIRIIGGRWRGRKLPVLSAEGLRPTTDRIKETLFNWLQFELNDKAVVDLFAGSGSLGFEALSRGASQAILVETFQPAIQQLEKNITTLDAPARVVRDGAEAFLSSTDEHSIDVLFMDPPFGKGWLPKISLLLTQRAVLKTGAWVYIENGPDDTCDSWPANWQLHRQKQTGQVTSRLFQVN